MLFSMIVPFYNSSATISRTVESLLNQSNSHFEAILVNDGSTDGSLELVRDLTRNDSRFSIISASNSGVACSRNVGLKKAKGEYVVFLDADDFVPSEFFSTLSQQISTHLPDVLVFLYRVLEGDVELSERLPRALSRLLGNQSSLHFQGFFPAGLLWRVNPSVWNKCFRRDFLEKNQICFNPAFAVGEDVEFTFRSLMLAQSVALSADVLYTYRTGVSSSLTAQSYPVALASIRAIQVLLNSIDMDSAWRDALYEQLCQFGLRALYERPQLESLRELARIVDKGELTDTVSRLRMSRAMTRSLSRKLWERLAPGLHRE